MVKLNMITRTSQDFERDTKQDLFKVHRLISDSNEPMGQALEYQRAINAAKMQKIFSQPYLYTLNDHTDGISTMCKVRENVSKMISGSFNGEVIVWDLIKRSSIYKVDAFRTQTKEICA